MNFPKKIMKSGELIEMGFTRPMLDQLAHAEGQTYAFRTPGGRAYRWDTEKLQRALDRRAVR